MFKELINELLRKTTQREIARELGVSQASVHRLKMGLATDPPYSLAMKIKVLHFAIVTEHRLLMGTRKGGRTINTNNNTPTNPTELPPA